EDAGVVHQRVDAAESLHGRLHNPPRGVGIAYIAGHRRNIRVAVTLRDRPRGCSNAVAPRAKSIDQSRTDALRRAGDDRNLLSGIHVSPAQLPNALERGDMIL